MKNKSIIYDSKDKSKESNKVPIKRDCNIPQCFCSGKCNQIIGYKTKDIWNNQQ